MTTQLRLFEFKEQLFEVTYWAFPYDKKGNLINNYCSKWVEIINKQKLDFWMQIVFYNDDRYVKIDVREL